MFTGLTERVGRLDRLTSGAAGVLARIGCGDLAPELRIGESVAVDGVCLTVVGMAQRETMTIAVRLRPLGALPWEPRSRGVPSISSGPSGSRIALGVTWCRDT